jgi:hypothetical protein
MSSSLSHRGSRNTASGATELFRNRPQLDARTPRTL